MKTLYVLILAILILLSCKRNEITPGYLATVSVVNTVLNGKTVGINNNLRDSCPNMDFKHFNIIAGNKSTIRVFPSDSPGKPYFEQSSDTKPGSLFSLFLTGTAISPESVWIQDDIPVYPTEDVINVRLVNLSPGSASIGLTVGDEPGVKIFSGIAYKQVSEFKTIKFPNPLPINRNLFQIRDDSGNLLFTYNMPAGGKVSQASSRHRNITIGFKGIPAGLAGNEPGVVILPHY